MSEQNTGEISTEKPNPFLEMQKTAPLARHNVRIVHYSIRASQNENYKYSQNSEAFKKFVNKYSNIKKYYGCWLGFYDGKLKLHSLDDLVLSKKMEDKYGDKPEGYFIFRISRSTIKLSEDYKHTDLLYAEDFESKKK